MGDFDIERIAARFWSKAEKQPDGCWIWTAGRDRKGYGIFGWPKPRRAVTAHRAAFYLENGRFPEPMGLHRCDNPSCVNPDHIFEGDARDNAVDMYSKGRGNARGPAWNKNHFAKLNPDTVRAIRASHGSTVAVGRMFDVSPQTVSYIRRRITWAWVPD